MTSAQLLVDGQDVATGIIKTEFVGTDAHTSNYMQAYRTLEGVNGVDDGVPVSRLEYPNGYFLLRFVTQSDTADGANSTSNGDVLALKRMGNLRLSLTFKEALAESYTLIMLAKFPAAIQIDKTKGVREL